MKHRHMVTRIAPWVACAIDLRFGRVIDNGFMREGGRESCGVLNRIDWHRIIHENRAPKSENSLDLAGLKVGAWVRVNRGLR